MAEEESQGLATAVLGLGLDIRPIMCVHHMRVCKAAPRVVTDRFADGAGGELFGAGVGRGRVRG